MFSMLKMFRWNSLICRRIEIVRMLVVKICPSSLLMSRDESTVMMLKFLSTNFLLVFHCRSKESSRLTADWPCSALISLEREVSDAILNRNKLMLLEETLNNRSHSSRLRHHSASIIDMNIDERS